MLHLDGLKYWIVIIRPAKADSLFLISNFEMGGHYYSLELFIHVFPTENHKRNEVFQNHVQIRGRGTSKGQ